MKIDPSLKSLGNAVSDNRTDKNVKADNAPTPTSVTSVSVDLRGHSSPVHTAMAGGEVVDAARVNEIKQAMSEGRFKVNPDVVADRLLKTVRELIGTVRH